MFLIKFLIQICYLVMYLELLFGNILNNNKKLLVIEIERL